MAELGAWPLIVSIALLAFRLAPPSEGGVALFLGRLGTPEVARRLDYGVADLLSTDQCLPQPKVVLVDFPMLGCEVLEFVLLTAPLVIS